MVLSIAILSCFSSPHLIKLIFAFTCSRLLDPPFPGLVSVYKMSQGCDDPTLAVIYNVVNHVENTDDNSREINDIKTL